MKDQSTVEVTGDRSGAPQNRTRYFRFAAREGYSDVPGYVDIAGIQARDGTGAFIDTTAWRIQAINQNPMSTPDNLLDGDINSAWRATVGGGTGSSVTIDMGEFHSISSICYIPKPPGSEEQTIRLQQYSLYFFSATNEEYLVKSGQLHPGYTTQDIIVDPDVERSRLCVISRMHHATEHALKNKSQYWADFEPTGRYCRNGDSFNVELPGELPQGAVVEVIIGTYFHHSREGWPEVHALQRGQNRIVAGQAGLVYIRVVHGERPFYINIALHGTYRAAYYKLGETTKSEWEQLLAVSSFIPSAQLFSGKVAITVSVRKAQQFLAADIDDLLRQYNRIIDRADEVAGYAFNQIPMHQPTLGIHQFVECGWSDMFMFAGAFATAYHVDMLHCILTPQSLTTAEGWGPWHELGHTYQDHLMNWHESMESTNNLTSIAIEDMYGATPKWLTPAAVEEAYRWLQLPDRTIEEAGAATTLVMLLELQGLFGDMFYQALFRLYRVNSKDPDFIRDTTPIDGNTKVRSEMFAIMCSTVARRNLVAFFTRWGFNLLPTTIGRINDLGFPEQASAADQTLSSFSCTAPEPVHR